MYNVVLITVWLCNADLLASNVAVVFFLNVSFMRYFKGLTGFFVQSCVILFSFSLL